MTCGKIFIPKEHHGKTPKPATYTVDEKGCWICTSHTLNQGYPMIRRQNKMRMLSNFLFELLFNEKLNGRLVRHKCDTPSCINPDHLEPGTIADNNNDRHTRGRDARNCGVSNGNQRLEVDQVVEIKSNPNLSLAHFARKFGVYKSTISQIRKGKTWQSIKSV